MVGACASMVAVQLVCNELRLAKYVATVYQQLLSSKEKEIKSVV